jgi:small subunit ribosomal protein S4
MLPVKSKYKIAKRLGNGVFEQTQTQKFALSEARSRKERRGRGASDTYGLAEKQLSNYAHEAITAADPSAELYRALEMRADSIVYRAGFAPTRRAARQMLSHGHITINGRRTTVPSHRVKKGDVIAVREGSRTSPLFASLAEKEGRSIPQWLSVDMNLLQADVSGDPTYSSAEVGLDLATVFEFYSR